MTSKVEMGLMTGGIFPASNVSKNSQGQQDAFQGIMNNMTAAGQNTQNYQPKETATVRDSESSKESVEPSGKSAGQSEKAAENGISDGKSAETVKKAAESGRSVEAENTAVSETEEELLTEAAEKLGITVEELEEILAQMGLTAWDLLEPENISALVVKVMGDGDRLSLVTDEKLSQTVLDLNAAVKEIKTELADRLGIDEAELKNVLEEVTKQVQDEVETVVPQSKAGMAEMAQNVNEMPVTEEQSGDIDAPQAEEEIPAVNGQIAQDAAKENGENTSQDAQNGQKGFDRNRAEDALMRHQPVREDQIGALQQPGTDRPVVQEMALEAARELMGSSPTEIINQINAYIRQNAASRITEWQMQLNPEHLGTVSLNVTAKEGAVTAQFTTQNEAVKAVMEAQVMVLKENLEQQGVKVEAVEVTVASHEFEQNLQQGDDSNRQMEEEQESLRKATRKIDLGEFASLEDAEALDEAEQVTVEMMQADGNRMDYKV